MFLALSDNLETKRFPEITTWILLIITGVFFYQTFALTDSEVFLKTWGFTPNNFIHGLYGQAGLTIFTSVFLHLNWLHLVGNALMLFVFGDNVEDKLGRTRFAFLFIVCGLFANVIQALYGGSPNETVIGASGAIAGIMGAFLILCPDAELNLLLGAYRGEIASIKVPSIFYLIFWFSTQCCYVFMAKMLCHGAMPPVALWAHIGGFIMGAFLAYVFLLLKGGEKAPAPSNWMRVR